MVHLRSIASRQVWETVFGEHSGELRGFSHTGRSRTRSKLRTSSRKLAGGTPIPYILGLEAACNQLLNRTIEDASSIQGLIGHAAQGSSLLHTIQEATTEARRERVGVVLQDLQHLEVMRIGICHVQCAVIVRVEQFREIIFHFLPVDGDVASVGQGLLKAEETAHNERGSLASLLDSKARAEAEQGADRDAACEGTEILGRECWHLELCRLELVFGCFVAKDTVVHACECEGATRCSCESPSIDKISGGPQEKTAQHHRSEARVWKAAKT
mmetsp:Transcript_10800/g.16203  ORF Transcript_10800/g.16203 Transcript_10800/m.16203 type:complete len:271 (+) Transcript_10800:204-1016(+)